MIFNSYLKEGTEDVEIPGVEAVDPNTEEGIKKIADEVEANMQTQALEAMTYYEGGEQALKEFCESEAAQVLIESRRLGKKTFVKIGKNDDLTRRKNLSCLLLAKAHKDPLFNKLALNRVKERKLRNMIYAKYSNKAERIARVSQQKHNSILRKMPSFGPMK